MGGRSRQEQGEPAAGGVLAQERAALSHRVQFENAIVLATRPRGTWEKSRPLPGDGFAYVATMFPSAEANFEWFEVTEVFTTVSPQQINAAMSARNGIASKQPVDFDDFLGMLRKGRPSRVEPKTVRRLR